MKKLFRLAILGAILVFGSSSAFGQQKFGYIDFQDLVSQMPERDSVQVKIQKLSEDYSSMLELMQVEFNNKYQDFQKNATTYTDAIRQVKERELQELNQRIEELYRTANQELETTSANLIAPIIEKAENAVKKVGRDNGYLAVFNLSTQPMLYYDEKNMTDILPLVKKELGIK